MRRLAIIALLGLGAVSVACLDFDKKLSTVCMDKGLNCFPVADANGYDVALPEARTCRGGWCFENPYPHGFDYRAVWGSGPGDVWLGGEGNTLVHYTGAWNVLDAGMVAVRGIWGKAANDIWFVGGDRVPLRWNGSSFSDEPDTVAHESWAVTGFDDRVLWGTHDGLFKKSGAQSFTRLSLDPDFDDISVAALSEQDCWTIRQTRDGERRRLVRCDGVFDIDGGNNDLGLAAVWAGNGSEVWAGGLGLQLHNPGATLDWRELQFSTRAGTFVPGRTSEYVSVGEAAGVFWPRMSGEPTELSSDARSFSSVWSSGPNDVWAAGLGGLLWHWNGTMWTPLSRGITPTSFYGLAVGGDTVQAVGTGAVIAGRSSTGTWAEVPPRVDNYELRAISLLPDGGGYAAGYDIRSYFGGQWRVVVPNTAGRGGLQGIFVRSATDGWAVGADIAFQLMPDAGWEQRDVGISDAGELFDVAGNATRTWAVGSDSTGAAIVMELFSNGSFVRDDPPAGGLRAVWVPPTGTTVVAVGAGCAVWTKDPQGGVPGWSSRSCGQLLMGRTPTLFDVWGFSESDVWAVGAEGVVLHGDFGTAGTSLELVPTALGIDRTLEAVRGAPGHLWIAGQFGVVLHRDHP